MAIQWRLAEVLKQRGWTAYRLAKEAGLTPSTVYKLLKKGDLRHIDAATIEALAKALHVKPFTLLEWTPDV